MMETGVFSSWAASATNVFVRAIDDSIRSSSRLNVAASRPSSSSALPTSSRCGAAEAGASAMRAACRVITSIGRSARVASQ